MGRILLFIYNEMADFEVTYIAHLLGSEPGKEIVVIANEDKIIRSKSGLMYKPEKLVKDVLDEDTEGLIIPGGWRSDITPELIQLIQSLNSKGKLLAAICAGPVYLAKAGVLDNVKYTTSLSQWTETQAERYLKDDPFPRQNFVSARIIRDGNIITSQGYAFVDFAVEICDWFGMFDGEDDKNEFVKTVKGV